MIDLHANGKFGSSLSTNERRRIVDFGEKQGSFGCPLSETTNKQTNNLLVLLSLFSSSNTNNKKPWPP
jgi:hypothetical protein